MLIVIVSASKVQTSDISLCDFECFQMYAELIVNHTMLIITQNPEESERDNEKQS